jgi:hypothetical protein
MVMVYPMIPNTNYYPMEGVGAVITKRLFLAYHSQEDLEIFLKWMRGQTCTEYHGEEAFYSWDYERWMREGKETEQGEDWD